MPQEDRPPAPPADLAPPAADLPAWPVVLRALREAAGVNQEAWARALEVGRTTVQRWERGETVPDPTGQARLLDLCRERGLFRRYNRGALVGVTVTAELMAELLADARRGVRGGRAPPTRSVMAPATSPGNRRRTNLPAPLSSFVGRAVEQAAVQRLLGSTRLLTLTGTGGVGKTRLALAVGHAVANRYRDGVWWVDLGALTDPALVPQAVTAALGVREAAGQPLTDTLAQFLETRHLLLVLDNCEHLVTACATLAETLLSAAPQVQVLATSREGLRVPGETRYRVPSLTLPDRKILLSAGDLAQSEAVWLFAERARAAWPEFAVTAETALAVTELCWRLDGIPLALELAAARLRVLSVEEIATRLDDRFRVLTRGSRTAPPRHQTLRATLDWSYDLLSERERTLLRRLAVFAGGWTLEAAEAVCAGSGLEAGDVLDLFDQLEDKSLVLVDAQGGAARYWLLETVRQYAREKLQEAGEVEAVRERHARLFLALAERAQSLLEGPNEKVWLDRLETELDNLRAALDWLLAGADVASGLRLTTALVEFWVSRGYRGEGRAWLETGLAARESTTPPVRAAALRAAGWLAGFHDDFASERAFSEEALALFRTLGDRRGIVRALLNIAMAAHSQGRMAEARALSLEDLTLAQAAEDRESVYWALLNLGMVAFSDNAVEEAGALFEQSLIVARELQWPSRIGGPLILLGELARVEGDFGHAAALYEESLAIYRDLGMPWWIALSLSNLAQVAVHHGDAHRAATLVQEAIPLFERVGSVPMLAACVMVMAAVAGLQGQSERAARLLGASEARRHIGEYHTPADAAEVERTAAMLRAALGEEGFAAARAAGRALSLDQAIAEALSEAAPEPGASG